MAATLLDWVESSAQSPFSAHPPDSVLDSVQAVLADDNAHHAKANLQTRLSEYQSTDCPVSRTDATESGHVPREWSVGPSPAWLQAPIVSRPSVGRDLLDQAASSIRNETLENLHCPYRMDTWSSPFTVGYLNVGRRHLVGSRPDILFLGDLVTSREHIGRLKKRLESALQDEWFMTTNISAHPGWPGGWSHRSLLVG